MKNKKTKINSISGISNILLNIVFIIVAICCIYPLLVVIGVSFSSENSVIKYGYSAIPHQFSTYAYTYIGRTSEAIFRAYGVTIFVTVVGTFLGTLITALFAYAISRREFRFRNTFSFLAFFTMLFNGGMVPWYIVCVKVLHINDSIWALLLPYLANAFYVIVLKTFFVTTIPDSIVEAARIDGAGEFTTFFKIVLPISKAGLATVALFNTLYYWNDWWLPLMLINNPNLYNIQYVMYKLLNNIMFLQSMHNPSMGMTALNQAPGETARMAMCVISIGPIIFAYPFFQKYFVKGLTIGAVKG